MNNIDLSTLSSNEALYLKAKYMYYKGEPIMSDEDFDILEDLLEQSDSFVTSIVGTISETKKGFKISKGKIKMVLHDSVMGSLDKVKFTKDYVPYDELKSKLLSKYTQNVKMVCEPKLDGNAGSIKYVDGHLVHIASRGDGTEGQDYTHLNIDVPKYIKNFTGEIRGEFVIDVELFNQKYGKDSNLDKKFANARNFVAGTLSKGEKDRVEDIDFVAFQIVNYEKDDTSLVLRKYGFQTLDFVKEVNSFDLTESKFVEIYDEFTNYRQKCKYQLDGFVIKYPEHVRPLIGGNSHHPFWAVAVKFIAEIVSTKVTGIEWTLGKRGQMTPIALLEPVELMGSMVSKASLYNASWLLNNNCYPGAVVSIIKSGDIIPKIVNILVPSSETYELPKTFNDNTLTFNGTELLMNGFEQTAEYKSLMMFHTLSSLGFKGIGPSTAAKIAECNITVSDIFSENAMGLHKLLTKNGIFKDGRELEVLINNLLDVTKVELWEIIYSFGYINCGQTISKQLANYIANIEYDFKGLEKKVVEDFINNQYRQDEVLELVKILQNNNVTVVFPQAIGSDIITFEMTGENPDGRPKGVYKNSIEQTGKARHTSLKKGTHYLITDSLSSNSGKMQKAKKLGIKIVTYSEFEQIINEL